MPVKLHWKFFLASFKLTFVPIFQGPNRESLTVERAISTTLSGFLRRLENLDDRKNRKIISFCIF